MNPNTWHMSWERTHIVFASVTSQDLVTVYDLYAEKDDLVSRIVGLFSSQNMGVPYEDMFERVLGGSVWVK